MEKKKIIILVVVLVVILLLCGAVFFGGNFFKKNNMISLGTEILSGENKKDVKEESVKIYQGNDRPIAIMIDNHKAALPQGGLNDAYMVYEIIVEGGESRLMALFKGANTEKIGPVRSSRHYFLDYALENDAIYVHYGWSPQAEYDIGALKVQNINGITESSSDFWRVKDKSSPHNVATSIAAIKKIAERKNYRVTSDAKSVLNYVSTAVNLDDGTSAINVVIPYSDSNTVKYTYDANTQRYQRYSKGVKETDWTSGEAITTKNIIIEFAKNSKLVDSENKDRQTLDNIKTLNGYYITNGKAIKITCAKNARNEKTVYKDLSGNEIKVNDGNTFVQICPIDSKVEITGDASTSNDKPTKTTSIVDTD